MTRADILITAAELARLLDEGRPVRILDVRWTLAEPDGSAAYARGHLPGAVYVSLDDELSDHTVAGRGRHPLPSGAAVGKAARRWGLSNGVPTVVYDDWNRAGSARAWWVLTAAGIGDVRILDGGLAAWVAAGGRLETGAVVPPPGDVSVAHQDLYRGALPTLTADQVAAFDGVLLDARPPERFRGESEPVDPVAGHIPGARNAPSTALLTEDGTFLAEADIAGFFRDRGVGAGEVGVYCGSGVTAAVTVAALRTAGVPATLFPGSWSQWCADPARPVATGE
ncbi:sulfurtransferase [Mycobacterium sp. NAZ190054]|uniref:sulfurtransferase n=1 Tax=Mycobacterium sp. NAZ190054 TaxID=1747766 RepID=UPI00079B5E39|nr:sulfurtransferase [Mycobacterium sp. NAZ190054]KWX57001.1 thiosulfate sulfurtransferase [Mycobacterium sp. NAZ190054]